MKNTDRAWLAGIIDGEGGIEWTCRRPPARSEGRTLAGSWVLRVRVTMTHRPTIERLCEVVGHGVVGVPPVYEGRRQAYYVAWEARKAEAVLEAVRPYVVTKRDQVELCLEVVRMRREWKRVPREGGGRGGHTLPMEAHVVFAEYGDRLRALNRGVEFVR